MSFAICDPWASLVWVGPATAAGLLANLVELKKAAEVANALALTHGARMRGPKRMKMTAVLIGCIVARKTREGGSP